MSIRYPLILSALQRSVWMATPAAIEGIARALYSAEHGSLAPAAATTSAPDRLDARSARLVSLVDGAVLPLHAQGEEPRPERAIAILPIFGVIAKYLSNSEAECGGFDLVAFEEQLRQAAADPSVVAIVLHAHTPGGVTYGVPEASHLIAEVAQSKPVYAWTDSEMASAGYHLCASGSGVFCSPNADVGCIGTYCAWIDEARYMAAKGLDLQLFRSGKFKGLGLPGTVDPEAAALLQKSVDQNGAEFRAWVVARRAILGASVDPAAMEGQCLRGPEALSAGLVDGVFPTFSAFLQAIVSLTNS